MTGIICIKLCKTFFNLLSDIFICFLYIPPSNSVYFNMQETDHFELLEQYIHTYSRLGHVSIIGDLNSRCGHKSDVIDETSNFDRFIPVIDSHIDQNSTFILPERVSQDSVCNSSGQKLLDICNSTDIRIVNGRMGEDAGSGNMTFMNANGESVIDYVLMSSELFKLIDNFIVHDFYSFSSHSPIQVNLIVKNFKQNDIDENIKSTSKIRWDENKKCQYKDVLSVESGKFEEIVNNIISDNINFNEGVDTFANTLYTCSYSIFGVSNCSTHSNIRGSRLIVRSHVQN